MKGRRRGLRLSRTAWWLLTSRVAIILAVVAVLVVLAAAAAWTKPWQAVIEERVVYVPVRVVITVDPDGDRPAPSGGPGGAPPSTPASDRAQGQS